MAIIYESAIYIASHSVKDPDHPKEIAGGHAHHRIGSSSHERATLESGKASWGWLHEGVNISSTWTVDYAFGFKFQIRNRMRAILRGESSLDDP